MILLCVLSFRCDTQRELSGVQVSTVDAFQGGERDVMILSTVRTGSLGFIDSDKSVNSCLFSLLSGCFASLSSALNITLQLMTIQSFFCLQKKSQLKAIQTSFSSQTLSHFFLWTVKGSHRSLIFHFEIYFRVSFTLNYAYFDLIIIHSAVYFNFLMNSLLYGILFCILNV